MEAESKGCTPSDYGLLFGTFELVVFIVSRIIGSNLNRLGVKNTFVTGICSVGVSTALFGPLDLLQNGRVFLAFSFVLRAIDVIANAHFLLGASAL